MSFILLVYSVHSKVPDFQVNRFCCKPLGSVQLRHFVHKANHKKIRLWKILSNKIILIKNYYNENYMLCFMIFQQYIFQGYKNIIFFILKLKFYKTLKIHWKPLFCESFLKEILLLINRICINCLCFLFPVFCIIIFQSTLILLDNC